MQNLLSKFSQVNNNKQQQQRTFIDSVQSQQGNQTNNQMTKTMNQVRKQVLPPVKQEDRTISPIKLPQKSVLQAQQQKNYVEQQQAQQVQQLERKKSPNQRQKSPQFMIQENNNPYIQKNVKQQFKQQPAQNEQMVIEDLPSTIDQSGEQDLDKARYFQEDLSMDVEYDQQQKQPILKQQLVEGGQKQETTVQQQNEDARKQSKQLYIQHRVNGRFASTQEEPQLVKKTLKKEKPWLDCYQMTTVQPPRLIPNGQHRCKKKYEIYFTYQDLSKNPPHQHTKKIKFGRQGVLDMIDLQDDPEMANQVKAKFQTNIRIHTCENPFKANFWALHLLYSSCNLQKNYINFLGTL